MTEIELPGITDPARRRRSTKPPSHWADLPPDDRGPAVTTAGLPRFRADQITTGLGINLLAAGLTRFVLVRVFHSSSNSDRVPGLPEWAIPGVNDLPGVGALLSSPLVLITLALVAAQYCG